MLQGWGLGIAAAAYPVQPKKEAGMFQGGDLGIAGGEAAVAANFPEMPVLLMGCLAQSLKSTTWPN